MTETLEQWAVRVAPLFDALLAYRDRVVETKGDFIRECMGVDPEQLSALGRECARVLRERSEG